MLVLVVDVVTCLTAILILLLLAVVLDWQALFAVNTHYFWEDFEKCKNEIIRVLKNGGQFIIGGRTKESLSKFEFSNYGFNLYSKEDFIIQFKSNQLSTIEYAFEEENIQFPDGNYGTIENICFFGRKN